MKESENIGGWVVMIKLKANISSTGTGLPTGTELGNNPQNFVDMIPSPTYQSYNH